MKIILIIFYLLIEMLNDHKIDKDKIIGNEINWLGVIFKFG